MVVPKPQKLGVGMTVRRKDRAYKPYSNRIICVAFACPVFYIRTAISAPVWLVLGIAISTFLERFLLGTGRMPHPVGVVNRRGRLMRSAMVNIHSKHSELPTSMILYGMNNQVHRALKKKKD